MGISEDLRAMINDLQELDREIKGDRLVILEAVERARRDPEHVEIAALEMATSAMAGLDALVNSQMRLVAVVVKIWGESLK